MRIDLDWSQQPGVFSQDIEFGFLNRELNAPKRFHPQVVLNTGRTSVLRTLKEEILHCSRFSFSVAFVSSAAVAMLKQTLRDFEGEGQIITADYLGFNTPAAFEELKSLEQLGVHIRRNTSARGFHPKGYVFHRPDDAITAMIGSSNFTAGAITTQHELNLKVSASPASDLAQQIEELLRQQTEESVPLTQDWIDAYATSYRPPQTDAAPVMPEAVDIATIQSSTPEVIEPNAMQQEALKAIAEVRTQGERKAIVISATGTGKTILSAIDVRAYAPERMMFLVHREQILDKTMEEYRKVLGGPASDYGKLAGSSKQSDRKYVFATVQTLSRDEVLHTISPQAFDYVLVDEAHRVGAATYQKVLDHLEPGFLLGLTATPERGDDVNVFEHFHYNVPYEIRLNDALEAGMLTPFHYYGVADVTFEDGSTTDERTDLTHLISAERVDHLVQALEIYGQAGVPSRGLIFCSRKQEAASLSAALNTRRLRGQLLRTDVLTGEHSIAEREAAVGRLEDGELDYLLTVDIFNEGVDIPSVNQVVMLRQTESAIVFVQQLGRGLRKAPDKEYLVVIDFIGNYANNYLVPVALFGDESLNKESLRKNFVSAEETGVIAGLSSIQFDRIAQERVLRSISDTKLNGQRNLKNALEAMNNRLGERPRLYDFYRFKATDPVVLATAQVNYPALVQRTLGIPNELSQEQNEALRLLSHEVLAGKRLHEVVLFEELWAEGSLTRARFEDLLLREGLGAGARVLDSVVSSYRVDTYPVVDQKKYGQSLIHLATDGSVYLNPKIQMWLREKGRFREEAEDLFRTARKVLEERYSRHSVFTPGRQYARRDVARLLGWGLGQASTMMGYRSNVEQGVCPIFVTLHKSEDVEAHVAYDDKLLDPQHLRWFTRSGRTLASPEVQPIINNTVDLHIFVKKDDADGTDFYYLGQAHCEEAEQTTMPGQNGESLDVVKTLLRFVEAAPMALYDYFHPTTVLAS